MGLFSNKKEPVSKVFVNRNEDAEMHFYNKYARGVSFANSFIIPLLKEFGTEIAIDNILDYQKGDTRDRFIDLLIGKKTNGRILPAELKRLQDIANKEFDEALEKVIKQGKRYTATLESQAAFRKKYDGKISSLQSEMLRYGEQSPRYNEAQKEINETCDHISKFEGSSRNELKRVIEDEKVYFAQEAEEKHLLSFATGFLILDSDTLQFDRAKVAATFGVYADTAQEVALLDKLKQLAALTNEIFGKEYPGAQVAFSAFFEMENGKVILSKNIKKETLSEYAKNM
jgi:hypothetical protein